MIFDREDRPPFDADDDEEEGNDATAIAALF
jgi:hypothetical protein